MQKKVNLFHRSAIFPILTNINLIICRINMKQKELTDLSLEELWQLFPIALTPYQDC